MTEADERLRVEQDSMLLRSMAGLVDADVCFTQPASLVFVDLSVNGLHRFDGFAGCHALQEVWLQDNMLDVVPDSLLQLQCLTVLSLARNGLRQLPAALSQLGTLRELYLGHNRLSTVPDALGELQELRHLDLSSNAIHVLPESLGNLCRLQTLILQRNRLRELPRTLEQLVLLWKLELSQNELTELPNLSRLLRLDHLAVHNNHLTTLPDLPVLLLQITLHHNWLSALPDCFGQLERVRALSLRSNRLTTLPHSIGNLSRLTQLDCSENCLVSLPNSLVRLVGLRSLDLSGNPALVELPAALGSLTQLTSLLQDSPQMPSDLCALRVVRERWHRTFWSLTMHGTAPTRYRDALHSTLMCAARVAQQDRDGLPWLPPELWLYLFGFLRNDTFGPWPQ